MDASLALTLLQTILELLNSSIFREIRRDWGYRAELEKLRETVQTIAAVLNAVENQKRLQLSSSISPITLDGLMEAVYELDHLLDEIATLAQCKKLLRGNKMSQDIRLFFSRFNQLHYAFTKSRKIRIFRERLDAIAKDFRDSGLVQGQEPTLEVGNHPKETFPSVFDEDVMIGRDNDRQIVMDLLLGATKCYYMGEVVGVRIVGMVGLGKTTLAQSVYNDVSIKYEFELKMWVSVSHDDNLKLRLCKILAAATKETNNGDLTIEQLGRNLGQALEGKKYLLVLDGLWSISILEWDQLKNCSLRYGARGSRILITTRSLWVAQISSSYEVRLKGLSDEDSWKLFLKMVLEPGQVQMEAHLVEMGKDIVGKCHNVPFAIKVLGTLLRGQGADTWHNLKNTDLANIDNGEIGAMMSILKASYNYLPPHLKSCFNFCAIYPKGYEIIEEDLINLWMAHGFLAASGETNLELVGHSYFEILLDRCFFQVVKEDGNIATCTMHDFSHDLAKAEAGIGIKSSSDDISSLNDKTHHILINGTIIRGNYIECYLTKMKRLRTCLGCRPYLISNYGWLSRMRFLRVLDLSQDYYGPRRNLKLPSMIGKLVHLRYLNLSCNDELSTLPNSITQLFNLETLKLRWCHNLKELPKKLSKLVNLRHLDIWGCNELRHMPPRMDKMRCLCILTMFVVGGTNNEGSYDSLGVGRLEELSYLYLKNKIRIELKEGWRSDLASAEKRPYLIDKHLTHIEISWNHESLYYQDAEELLQVLQPSKFTRILRLFNYTGVKFPNWWGGDSSMNLSNLLPHLVELRLSGFTSMKHVPLLSQLECLKVLQLWGLWKVEYLQSRDRGRADAIPVGSRGVQQFLFFPSLEKLVLCELPMLKGWWKASSHSDSDSGEGDITIGNDYNDHQEQEEESPVVAFPCLADVFLRDCPELTTFPSLPKLEKLRLRGSKKALGYFHSLPRESFQHLSSLSIQEDDDLEKLSKLEVFRTGHLSSLRSLELRECSKFKSVSAKGVWEHFTALETLALGDLKELELENEGNDNADMPWTCLASSLRSLKLDTLPKLRMLPMGMRHLTTLRSLSITHCYNLEEIPTWISCLTSLQDLSIDSCPRVKFLPQEMCHLTSLLYLSLYGCSRELRERCKQTGADWYIIQNIPTKRL